MEDQYSKFPSDLHLLARLFDTPRDFNSLVEQVGILRSMLLRLIQEVEALRVQLEEKKVIDSQSHKQAAVQVMLGDRGGPGASPWRSFSYAGYLLGDEKYLRMLGLNDAEIEEFEQRAQHRQQLT